MDNVQQGVEVIASGFDQYIKQFSSITCRAKDTFERRDWHGQQRDALERLELYKKIIDVTTPAVQQLLGSQIKDENLWSQMRAAYAERIAGYDTLELAETFFNSVTRRIFTTVGVNPEIEFVELDFARQPPVAQETIYHIFPSNLTATSPDLAQAGLAEVLGRILDSCSFQVEYANLEQNLATAAREMEQHLQAAWGEARFHRIEVLKPVFYRGTGAYLIGRVCLRPPGSPFRPGECLPLTLCLLNKDDGLHIDALLMDEDEVSIVFSFSHSYFHVDVQCPRQLITFLKSIIPLKRIAELYISIGYNKHGKTELYRELMDHMENSTDRFQIARGERGMVMVVFTLPSFDLVFKVIRDFVDPPKTSSRQDVMERYDLVFKHDRAGRLIDAQEFEYLSFWRSRFSPELIQELLTYAPSQVLVNDTCVTIKHLYIERRLTPLNLYVKEAGEEAAHQAVVDYGKAIKDLAATNIFPGDVLLKNFGVTRHGRVVFYDYDELCLLTVCKFRRMPQPRSYDDEFASEPFFYVGPLDIFPEEFRTFLGLVEPLRSTFIEHHADLFGTEFWRDMQRCHQAGEVVEILPYAESRRL
jgi:isocitrate dehydrogenase kinase/phosphatase